MTRPSAAVRSARYSTFALLLAIAPHAHADRIAAGAGHSCAIVGDGALYCWGGGESGQIGDGVARPFPETALPTRVALPDGAVAEAVTACGQHTCARTTDRRLFCWGSNNHGQLGDGTVTNRTLPAEVALLGDEGVVDVAAGRDYTCALTTSGGIQCWGFNDGGQLGDGSQVDRQRPVTISLPNGAGATRIAAGNGTTCAVSSDGLLLCWGYNSQGGLGDGTHTPRRRPAPVQLPPGATPTWVSPSGRHSCAVAGSVLCWGFNVAGQVGDGTLEDRPLPVPVTLPDGIVAESVSVGSFFSCAVATTGDAWCWGENRYGELGAGHFSDAPTTVPSAVTVPRGVSIRAIAASCGFDTHHACALAADGSVLCWGRDFHGELGNGSPFVHVATPGFVVLPDGVGPCTTVRCIAQQAYSDAACAGITIPSPIASRVERAATAADAAADATGKELRKYLKRAKRALSAASRKLRLLSRGRRPKLAPDCATAIRNELDAARAVLVGEPTSTSSAGDPVAVEAERHALR